MQPEPAVESLSYNDADSVLRRAIDALMAQAYGPAGGEPAPLHRQALNARAILVRLDGQLVGYAGVVHLTIDVAGQSFTMAGLSSVATDPVVQRRGIASLAVLAATRFIEQSGVDLGLFTCQPELVPLYARAGWQRMPGVTLIGSDQPDALRSDSLGAVVMMRLFSQRALAASNRLTTGEIDLGLPAGEFL